MYTKDFPEIAESVELLESRLKHEQNARLRSRLHLLLLIRSNQVRTRSEAAEHLRVHRNSVTNWLGTYVDGGLAALLKIGTTGPKSEQKTLPTTVFDALRERVLDQGFPSYIAVQEWLRREFELEIPYRTVHGLIRDRLGLKLKRSRAEQRGKR